MGWQDGEKANMTIQASGRSAFIIAAAVVLSLAGIGLAGTGSARAADSQTYSPFLPVGADSAPAAKQDVFPAPQAEAQAQAQPADAAVSETEQSEPTTVNMVTVSNDDGSGWDKASIIGKIFIACGTLLTLGSAARMFMI
jgi:flagellar basal body-associated protein FliL